jgi:hypothetical protein
MVIKGKIKTLFNNRDSIEAFETRGWKWNKGWNVVVPILSFSYPQSFGVFNYSHANKILGLLLIKELQIRPFSLS